MMSDTIAVKTKTCTVCDEYELWVLDRQLVERWRGGELIQDVFPDMSVNDREMLITGTHPACWDKLFPAEEEGESLQERADRTNPYLLKKEREDE
jgi:hypothetical protein